MAWWNPIDYATEIGKEGWSRLPGTADYDMRRPSSEYYGEKKSVVNDGRAYTPSEAGKLGIPSGGGANEISAGNTATTTPTNSYSSGSTASYNANDLAYLDSQKSLYDRLLQSADRALTSGITRLDDSTASAKGSAQLQYDRSMRDFGNKRTDTQNAKDSALGRVDTNARTLSDSLRRVLGMASGSGSSAYQLAAPNAVARQASQQRTNVLSNYGQNERDLDTAVDDTKVDFDNIIADITKQRRDKEEELRSGIYQQQQGINQSLSEIASQRAKLVGGNGMSAIRPYQDRYMSLQDQIDSLPSDFRTSVSGRNLNVANPTLKDYLVDRQAINANETTQPSAYSPYAQFLKKEEEKSAY